MTNQSPPPNWLLPPTPWAPWVPDVTLGRAPVALPPASPWVVPSIDAWDQNDSYRANSSVTLTGPRCRATDC